MPVSLSQSFPRRLPLAPLTDSWVPFCLPSPVQPSHSSTRCRRCTGAAAGPGRIPKVLHRPDFERLHSVALFTHFFVHHSIHSFISLAHPISPPPGPSSISSSHHHTSTLASSSLTVIYPPLERFILPSFPLALQNPPPKLHRKYCHDFVMPALSHTTQPRHRQHWLSLFIQVQNLPRNSPSGEQAHPIASLLFSDRSGVCCDEIDSHPLSLSQFLPSRSFAFTPRYDDAVLVTNASPASSLALTAIRCGGRHPVLIRDATRPKPLSAKLPTKHSLPCLGLSLRRRERGLVFLVP